MAIKIANNFGVRSELFLDDRIEVTGGVSVLKNWDFSNNPLPDGFEVCLDGVWYTYNKSNTIDPDTGYFRERTVDVSGKQDTLVSGVNIKTINNQSILGPGNITIEQGSDNFASGEAVSEVYISGNSADVKADSNKLTTGNAVYGAILGKQDKLIPGTGISITGNTISSTVDISGKQDTLVSGTNIKTINNESVLGSGNIEITFPDPVFKTGEKTEDIGLASEIESSETTIPKSKVLYDEVNSHYATSFQSILTPNHWIITPKIGVVVTVTSDPNELNNGVWYLKGSNYSIAENWIKLFGKSEINAGIENHLRNTAFLGEYTYEDVTGTTNMLKQGTYSSQYEYWSGIDTWNIIEDANSITGYSAQLHGSNLSQNAIGLLAGETYTVTWKQKGNITITFGGKTQNYTSSDYEYKSLTVIWETNPTFSATGDGLICEIKIAHGDIPTSWSPSFLDTSKLPDRINSLDFLKTAFTEYKGESVASGLILRTIIESGAYKNTTFTPSCGINGTWTDNTDAFIWSGGTLTNAQTLISNLINDPDFLSTADIDKLCKSIITFASNSVFTSIVARGKFYDELTGQKLGSTTRYGVSGVQPMKTLTGSTMGELNPAYIKFSNGLAVGYNNTLSFQWASSKPNEEGFNGDIVTDQRCSIYDPGTGTTVDNINKLTFKNGLLISATSSSGVSVSNTVIGISLVVLNTRGVDETGNVDANASDFMVFYTGHLVKVTDNETLAKSGLVLY